MALLAAVAVAAAVYGIGMAATAGGRVGIDDGLRRRLTIFSVGFCIVALATFALGADHLFDRTSLRVLTLVGAVLVVPFLPTELRALRATWRRSRRNRALVVTTAAIVAFDTVLAAAPPTSGDATGYHLAVPEVWLQAHHMVPVWWDLGAFQPFSVEMHFALAQVLQSGAAATAFGALLGAFSTACVYVLARELFGSAAAAAAALLWVAQGIFLWEATGGFVELALGGFVALAAAHLAAFARSQQLSDAAWCGLAVGLAVGTKYHGLAFLLPFALLVAVLTRGAASRRVVTTLGFLVVAAVGLPWYVRNWIVAGNPLYPFFSNSLGGKYMDAGSRYDLDQSLRGYGMPGLWRLPIFPLEFLLHTDRYERGYSFSPGLLAFTPLALAFGRRKAQLLAAGVLVYLLVWWEGMQQVTRYLLPGLALAAPLAGYAAVQLWRHSRRTRALVAVLVLATAAPFVAISGLFAWRLAPGAVGAETQAHFVQRLTGTYDAFRWLDTRLPPQGRVLVGIRDTYWLQRPSAVFTVPLFDFQLTTSQVVQRMRRYDIRYIAFFEGHRPAQFDPLRLHRLAALPVDFVTSRTLGTTQHTRLIVWAWCDAAGSPCARGSA